MDWKKRFRNKTFLISLGSVILLFAQYVGHIFGFDAPNDMVQDFVNIGNSGLAMLVILGVVIDPTTSGIKDVSKELDQDLELQ